MAVLLDRALLLKRTPFGESSLVVQVLSEHHGRVGILAKGAYRMTSRFFAVLDLCDTLELEWQTTPRSELGALRAASLLVRRAALPRSPRLFRAASTLLELCEITSRSGQPEPELFALATRGLDALQRAEPADAVLARFELELLALLGLPPALELCAACAGEAAPVDAGQARAAFSAGAGGRLCRRCAEEARAAGRRVGTLPVQVLADARSLSGAPGASLAPERLVRVRDFVERFLGYHLDVRPKSHASFLAAPNRNAPEPHE